MTSKTGYYSLIQYCPDPSRLEAANIGVLLFSPDQLFLRCRTVSSNRRIIRFFGRDGHDWHRINSFKKALHERLEKEHGAIDTLQDLERFIAGRANSIRLTTPRPMRVTDPKKDLDQLFKDLIDSQGEGERPVNLKDYLLQQFRQAGVENKIRTEIPVRVPAFERQIKIPYGYHNGRFNLIQPVPFRAIDASQVVTTACKYAVEGKSLYENPDASLGKLQLVVVGAFATTASESQNTVRNILGGHNVLLFDTSELGGLISDIKENGKPVQPPP